MRDLYDLAVDSLATFRLVRLWTRDTWPPVKAARERVEAAVEHRHGPDWAEGVTCPWCVGVYVAAGVVTARAIAPRLWRPAARGLALAAIAGIVSDR